MVSTFNLENLLQHLRLASENLNDVNFYHFSEAMLEYSNSFSFLGRALSMAFSDIITKAQLIQANFKNSRFTGLQSMILDEISRGVEKINSEPNISTARTVLRLLWFFDFLKELITNLINNPKWKLSKACSKAYDAALAPHHPWPVRMAASLGIKTVPNKQEYMNRLFGNIPYEQQIQAFTAMIETSTPLREALWNFYHQNKLTDLP